MEKYIWLFPILFLFHDMEEIIGFGIWIKKNRTMLKEKLPRMIETHKNFSTEGFAFAVFEEFIVCLIICLVLSATGNDIVSYIWLGAFVAYDLHLVIHIGQSILIKQYIPALITSIICLPVSTYMIVQCLGTISGGWMIPAAFMFLGIVIVVVNLKFAQKLIGWFTIKMELFQQTNHA